MRPMASWLLAALAGGSNLVSAAYLFLLPERVQAGAQVVDLRCQISIGFANLALPQLSDGADDDLSRVNVQVQHQPADLLAGLPGKVEAAGHRLDLERAAHS